MSRTPRGIRNSNPGNIELSKSTIWEGQAAQQDDGRFVQFTGPAYGIRAIVRVLVTYADKRAGADGSRIDTVQEIVDRWAPPHENNTTSYANHVRAHMGVAPGVILEIKNPKTMRGLVEAIILHENGEQPYTDQQITKGMVLAGIEPDFKPIGKTRTVQGARVAGAAGTVTTVAGIATEVAPALPIIEWLRDNLAIALVFAGVAALAGVGYMIWARYDDREKGLR